MLLLALGWMVLASASSSSDLHLLSPTSAAPLPPPALPRPDHQQGPRHRQPPVPIYRPPSSLRGNRGESCHQPLHLCSFPPLHHYIRVFLSVRVFSLELPPFLPPTVPLSSSLCPLHSSCSTANDTWRQLCIMEPCILCEIIGLIASQRHWQAQHPQKLYQVKSKYWLRMIRVPYELILLKLSIGGGTGTFFSLCLFSQICHF